MAKNYGRRILYLSTFITLGLWLFSKNNPSALMNDPLLALSQSFSLLGLMYMMANLALSTRLRFIENLWGGLDKVYESHHLLGITAFVLLINHPLLLAVKALPDVSMVTQYLLPGTYLPYTLGIFAQYIMLTAFIFILVIKLPYHMWKRTHQLLGFTGILGGAHALLISSDISAYMPLRFWMAGWIVLGTLSFLYIFFFYNTLGDVFVYEITKIERALDIINIFARPKRKKVIYKPGQFAYLTFGNKAVGNEQHPFSFSSAPNEDELRFSIKMMGDYTVKLPLLKKGDKMYLKGPYGKFGETFMNGTNPLVWIVGGIGITPFLSMLRYRSESLKNRKIILFYCYSSKEEGVFSDEIHALAKANKSIEVHEWLSSEKGRFSVARVLDNLAKLDNYDVQLCGPDAMMDSLKQQFNQIGVRDSRIQFERFQLI